MGASILQNQTRRWLDRLFFGGGDKAPPISSNGTDYTRA